MIDWPRVDIIVITYDRFEEIQWTIESLVEGVKYPWDRIRYLIADDATPGDYQQRLQKSETWNNEYWEDEYGNRPVFQFVPHAGQNLGWGANVNRALHYSTAPYILQLEDDRVLKRDFDLYAAIALMEMKPEIGMLRVGGTAGDHYVYHQMEADVSAFLPNYREGMALPGRCSYFLFDIGSPSLWIYSNTPHLKRSTFHQFYGMYPEGQKLGATEEMFCHMVQDAMRANPYYPVIAVQPEWVIPHFDHIGRSMQHGPLDIEHKAQA